MSKRNSGQFINGWDGYTLRKLRDESYLLIFTKAIYEFRLNDKKPLTFTAPDGTRYQPDRHCETDMGSIPLSLQMVYPKDRYLLSFLFHDSGWRHGGLYVKRLGQKRFTFQKMSLGKMNKLLGLMIRCEGACLLTKGIIRAGVELGALFYEQDKETLVGVNR